MENFLEISQQIGFPKCCLKIIKNTESMYDIYFSLNKLVNNNYGDESKEILQVSFSKEIYLSFPISFLALKCLFTEIINISIH